MKCNNKECLPAFTLQEVFIALAIFISLFSIILLIYMNITKGLNRIENRQQKFSEMQLLHSTIRRDFYNCKNVHIYDRYVELSFNEDSVIEYDFRDSIVVRMVNANKKDTLPAKIAQIEEIQLLSDRYLWTAGMKLTIDINGMLYPMTYLKTINNQEILNVSIKK